MTDHSALIERLEAVHTLDTPRSVTTGSLINPDGPEAAAALRDQEKMMEAAFMWAWARGAGTFLQDPLGQAEWRVYWREINRPLPSAPNQAKEAGE